MNENQEPHKQNDALKPQEQDAQADSLNWENSGLLGANIRNYAPNAQGSNIISGQNIFGNTFVGTQNNPTNIYPPPLPPPPTGTPSNLPYSGTSYFVGRDDTLAELHKQLQQNNQLAICAVSGMGGIGKTELAVQYALRHQEDYWGGLCWLQCRGADLGTQITNYGRSLLGLVMPDGLELPDQVAYCWNHWREGIVLPIYDDVVDYGEIAPYLPPKNKGNFKVLITSRQKAGSNYQRIDLNVLGKGAALALLRSLVGNERIDAELEQAEALCEWLGHLPLGLELVERYLSLDPLLGVKEVQKRLEQKKLAARGLRHQGQSDMVAQRGVEAAFELSWEELSPKARILGYRFSLFAPAPIEWRWVEECYPPHEIWDLSKIVKMKETENREQEYQEFKQSVQDYLEIISSTSRSWEQVEKEIEGWLDYWQEEKEEREDIRNHELVGRSLLQITEDKKYTLHPLLREFFIAKQGEIENIDECKRELCRVMVAITKQIPQTVTLSEITSMTTAIPHLKEVAQKLIEWVEDEDLIWLYAGLGRFYGGQSAYSEAERWYLQLVEDTQSRLGGQHPDVATSYNNLADLYQSMGRYFESEPLFQEALKIYIKRLGKHHFDVARSYYNLAKLYHSMGRYSESEPLFQEALEVRKEQLGENHLDVAQSYSGLAVLYRSMGRYFQAEHLHRKAFKIYIDQLGEHHPDVAISYNNLAFLYYSMGRYGEAEPLYQKALKIYVEQLGEEHPEVAQSYSNLAVLYQSMERFSEAEPLCRNALEIRLKRLGEKHPEVAQSYSNLAALYQLMERYSEAESLYQKALEIGSEQLGEHHPEVATFYNNLAHLYSSMGRYIEAIAHYEQALNITIQSLGEEHPNTVTIYNNYMGMLLGLPEEEILKALLKEVHEDS